MKELKNKIGRSRKKRYRIIANHKTKKNGQNEPETVKLTLNNGFHTADGKLPSGWAVSSINTEMKSFESFEKAAEEFESRTGDTPPTPEWF